MKIAPIIAALRDRCPTFARRIGGAAEWPAAAQATKLAMPCAFVVPAGEDADELYTMSNSYEQDIRARFSVVICISTAKQERGQDAADQADALKAEIWRAIVGLQTAETREIVYAGSTIIGLDRAKLVVQLDFAAPYVLSDAETAHGEGLKNLPDFKSIGAEIDPAPADWLNSIKTEIAFSK